MKEPACNGRFFDGDPLEAFAAALGTTDYNQPEPVLDWRGEANALSRLAAVDIDFHGRSDGNVYEVECAAKSGLPQPAYWWITHGGGLRAVFGAAGGYGADELAAVFAMSALRAFRRSFHFFTGFEIKAQTRHPSYRRADGLWCGKVNVEKQYESGMRTACNVLVGRESEVDEQDVDKWLEEEGLARREAYEHDRCPIEPGRDSHGKPVWVGDYGINCLSCATRGNGFLPWAALLRGNRLSLKRNRIRDMVRGMCHWSHAKHVYAAEFSFRGKSYMPEAAARTVHKALLRSWHMQKVEAAAEAARDKYWAGLKERLQAADPATCEALYAKMLVDMAKVEELLRVKDPAGLATLEGERDAAGEEREAWKEGLEGLLAGCFYPEDRPVRSAGNWVNHLDLCTVYADKCMEEFFKTMPAVRYVVREGKKAGSTEADSQKRGVFKSESDLADYGFASVEPLRGVDLRPVMEDGSPEIDPYAPVLAVVADRKLPYHYIPAGERDTAGVVRRFEDHFPGMPLDVVKLLIAAKGYAQCRPAEPTLIYFTGQSGAGKTTIIRLAAEITRDTTTHFKAPKDAKELELRIGSACGRVGYLRIDEIAKNLKPSEVETLLLNLKADATYRPLYHTNPVKFTQLPVLLLADTYMPAVFRESGQLARRTIHIDLGAGANADGRGWHDTCGGEVAGWMVRENGANRKAADVLVSEVYDLLQQHQAQTLEAFARAIGFKPISKTASEDVDIHAELRLLFEAACAAPDHNDPFFKGKGWKVFDPNGIATPLGKAWGRCVDPQDPGSVQRITGAQWGNILNKPGVELDYTPPRGGRVGIRFRLGKPRGKDVLFNADILPQPGPDVEPDTLPFQGRGAAGDGPEPRTSLAQGVAQAPK
jgi:hypothetical protein